MDHDEVWIRRLMTKVNETMNDMPTLRLLKHIRQQRIENLHQNTTPAHFLIDSHVLTSDTTIEHIDTHMPLCHDIGLNPKTGSYQATINTMTIPPETPTIAQSDSGANRIVTDNLSLLTHVKHITPMPMGGCNKEDSAAIICTATGILTITGKNNDIIKVKAYYSEEVDGTIISPTTIVTQLRDKFSGWMQFADCDSKTGDIQLIGKNGTDNVTLPIISNNDLWYHAEDSLSQINNHQPKINRLSNAAKYELWHQRLGHAGSTIMESIHKHVEGVPKLKGNSFYRCPSCMSGKLCTKRPMGKKPLNNKLGSNKPKALPTTDPPITPHLVDNLLIKSAQSGQHFHMDFGFVRGSGYSKLTDDGKTLTSKDGKKAYLAVVDRASRYTWIFLTENKKPPIEAAKLLLTKFKSTNPHRTVRVDQGGELGRSNAFKTMVAEAGFSLEPTGSDASAQNAIVENPNKILGQMMRCLLHSSGLGPEYWSWALSHAVYIKNRLPHSALNMTSYEKFTGEIPNLSNLRIFGSKIYARKPGKRPFKLDHNTSKGYFLGFTATDKNSIYLDADTNKIKTSTHIIFDEAHMSEPASQAPLAAQTLQRLGYYAKEDWIVDEEEENQTSLLLQQLSSTSTIPTRATPSSIGYDLHADLPHKLIIPAGTIMPIPTGLAMQCPTGTYARIAPRSGLTINKSLTTMAGVIDPDYRGNVTVLLRNFGNEHQHINPGDKIAQFILEQATIADSKVVDSLSPTTRDTNGFGSSDAITTPTTTNINPPAVPLKAPIIFDIIDELPIRKSLHPQLPTSPIPNLFHTNNSTAAAAKLFTDIQTTFEAPYAIDLIDNPYDNHTHRIVQIKPSVKHPTLGLVLKMCTDRDRPMLIDCKHGTPAIKIPRWKRELKGAYITYIDDTAVHTIDEITTAIQLKITNNDTTCKIGFSTIEKQAMHPQFGIPQLYHDQLNIIGQHLWSIKNDPETNKHRLEEVAHPISPTMQATVNALGKKKLGKHRLWYLLQRLPKWYKIAALKKRKKLTRRYLIQQPDWQDWKASEAKQLNQYEAQGTFGKPCYLPKGANLLPLLWTYLIKDCGTKKARCVCNGSPKLRGSITLADTYAGSLEQTGSRIFWSATAMFNFITIGADASNAFAEAPAPKAPLFVNIDHPFREWYKDKYPNNPPLSRDFVLPVHGALQGHPESARLWAKLIDGIIQDLNLKPCTHEPCLYYTNDYNNTGKTVLFLRQVDDFAVACEDKATATTVISNINSKMTIDVKELGLISRFNGIDVQQSMHFVKLYNRTYIEKILKRHEWINNEEFPLAEFPTPMISENSYQRKLETTEPMNQTELDLAEKEFGFGYRQGIGELIYALVTCRPDISYSVIKLAQYSTRPARIHFEAIKNIYRYLNATKDEGIYFWRKMPRTDMPDDQLPICKTDSNYKEDEVHEREQSIHNTMFGAVDSDFAGDISHRRSVSGIVLRIAGGTVFYKTKYQDTVALSSTEAEFTAAAEAGKYILYVRSILDEIGVPQNEATVLYEDNNGALLMANAQQPTKRTRHMDIKTFALQQWVEKDLIRLRRINTADNYSDVLTKATGRTLFYRHMNYILGKIRPSYVTIK